MGQYTKIIFELLGRTESEKNAMLFSSYHRIFIKKCATDQDEIFLHRVSIWVNIQKKFQVPWSHSIGEKCDAIFKLSSHFSRKVCDRGT